jgi:hypothetical protein
VRPNHPDLRTGVGGRVPFWPAGGQSAAEGAATIRPGCAVIGAGIGAAKSVSVFVSVAAGGIGPIRMIAVTDSSNSKIMNAREASST